MNFSVVFSRYAEPVDFLAKVRWPVTIYNKGETVEPPGPQCRVIQRPNLGMDTENVFRHLAVCYDELPEVTLFLCGSWRARPHNVLLPLEHYAAASVDPAWPVRWARWFCDPDWPGAIRHHGKWADLLADGTTRPSPWTLGDWWDRVVGGPRPERLFYCPGQTFSVAAPWVRTRPRAFYEQLAEFFAGHRYPEECHHMERTWAYLFRPGGRPDADLA